MKTEHLARLLRDAPSPEVFDWLTKKLNPTDLQSLLLAVMADRSMGLSPARVLDRFENDRFSRPSPISASDFLKLDVLLFSIAEPRFESVELSPLCPLGTASSVATASPDKAVATVRNSEVVADSTNVLALEAALRRRKDEAKTVRLCASHRLVRPQKSPNPRDLAHFRLFGLVTAGRDVGSSVFEAEALLEHLLLWSSVLQTLKIQGQPITQWRWNLTAWSGEPEWLIKIAEDLRSDFADGEVRFAPERELGRGYYRHICFQLFVQIGDEELFIGDGGFTDWTAKLLNNAKERLLISGIGSERLLSFLDAERLDPS